MITAKELINSTKDKIRNDLEKKMKKNAFEGYSGYVTRTASVPLWLQEELKECGYKISFAGFNDCQIEISWKEELNK